MGAGQGRLGIDRVLLLVIAAMPVFAAAEVMSEPPDPHTLTIPSGQSLVIHYPAVKRIAAGDGSIIDVKVFEDTDEVLVIARKEGVTDLRIWGRDGTAAAHVVKVLATASAQPALPALPMQATILLKARLIEVKKSVLRDIGIDWADIAAGPIVSSLPINQRRGSRYVALNTSVDSFINLLVNDGKARALAEPTLTCINGGHADFLAGGEVPIPVQNQDGALNVVFKQFGIILNVEPRADATGVIRTKVNVEVSSVDKGNQVLGIPGFATRKTSTEMNVRSGETMVIAGLLTTEDAKSVVKVPGLGQLPILGELFKSRQFRHGQSELLVLVTPHILQADSEEIENRLRRFDELLKESSQELRATPMD